MMLPSHRTWRAACLAALLGVLPGAGLAAGEAATPLVPSLALGVEIQPEPYLSPFLDGLAATASTLLVRNVAAGGRFVVHPGPDGQWQVETVPGAGRITPVAGGFLALQSGTTYVINPDLSRGKLMRSEVSFLDETTGAPRWSAKWDGLLVDSPVLLGGHAWVHTHSRAAGTAAVMLDESGKEVRRLKLPFDENAGAGMFAHGHELFLHGTSSFGPFVAAVDPATGDETWHETLGFGSPRWDVRGTLVVLHYPFDQGPWAVVDLAAHRVLKKGTAIPGLLERGMSVAGDAACFWGQKAEGRTGSLECLDMKTATMQWERSFEPGTRLVAGVVQEDGRLWIMVEGSQGPTHLLALDPANGATLRDDALAERLSLEPRVPAIGFQGLFVVGTKGGRVLGYALPRH